MPPFLAELESDLSSPNHSPPPPKRQKYSSLPVNSELITKSRLRARSTSKDYNDARYLVDIKPNPISRKRGAKRPRRKSTRDEDLSDQDLVTTDLPPEVLAEYLSDGGGFRINPDPLPNPRPMKKSAKQRKAKLQNLPRPDEYTPDLNPSEFSQKGTKFFDQFQNGLISLGGVLAIIRQNLSDGMLEDLALELVNNWDMEEVERIIKEELYESEGYTAGLVSNNSSQKGKEFLNDFQNGLISLSEVLATARRNLPDEILRELAPKLTINWDMKGMEDMLRGVLARETCGAQRSWGTGSRIF